MVSFMSAINACSSGVSKRSTSRAGSSRRGSPIRSTVLIAIDDQQLLEDCAHASRGALCHDAQLLGTDFPLGCAAAGRMIDDNGEGRVAHPELARESGLGHPRHADQVGAVALEASYFGRSF